MSYKATIFNIMIASPSDVETERSIIREVIYEWNAIHSHTRKIVLLPVGWETHASPEMGSPPQSIINGQLLSHCDLLVGVFWTKVGTPTERHPSGTVEEIEEHIRAGKPAMLYFSNRPVNPYSRGDEQFNRLESFKKSCANRAFYKEFADNADFKSQFNRDLQLTINQNSLFKLPDDNPQNFNATGPANLLPILSQEARTLLEEAANSPHGIITVYQELYGGFRISTTHEIVSCDDVRDVSKWKDALNQLVSHKLIVDRGNKGQVFEVTFLGHELNKKDDGSQRRPA